MITRRDWGRDAGGPGWPAGTGPAGSAGGGMAGRGRACQRGGPAAGDDLVTFVFMFESASVLDGLNDEQRAAAAHPGGPLLVLAGAGTGKTRTLVARAAWLGEQGVPPPRILLLTFTRRAADALLARALPC